MVAHELGLSDLGMLCAAELVQNETGRHLRVVTGQRHHERAADLLDCAVSVPGSVEQEPRRSVGS